MRFGIVFFCTIFAAQLSFSTTIYVPGTQPTIQGGIDMAQDGDTVLVYPATYIENDSIINKAVVLISYSGPSSTLIKPLNPNEPIITYNYIRDSVTVIDGFSVHETQNAPGVFCYRGSPTIRNCDIAYCNHDGNGGGILCQSSEAHIIDNDIHDNYCTGVGGGIAATPAFNMEVAGNRIYNNSGTKGAGIGFGGFSNECHIHHNQIWDNMGPGDLSAGIYADEINLWIYSNTITQNSHGVVLHTGEYVLFTNNIVTDNVGTGYYAKDKIPYYSVLWNNGSGDDQFQFYDINDDPMFADPDNDDFSLQVCSPCLDRGNPDSAYYDPDGTRADMGALPHNHLLPIGAERNMGEENIQHVVSHWPVFYWSYHDTTGLSQTAFELEVGTTCQPFSAQLFASGPMASSDTSIAYAGTTLMDDSTYTYRLRVADAGGWGEWTYDDFHMNLPPSRPLPLFPINDQTVPASAVQLVVDSISSLDNDTIYYDFEVYGDTLSAAPLFADTGNENNYSVFFSGLNEGQRYYWRARTFDRHEHSEWCGFASFITRVNTVIRVPHDQPTIQAGINAASSGDTVMVSAGDYSGDGNRDIVFYGRAVLLQSTSGADQTIIDCQSSPADPHRGFQLISRERLETTIDGFTVVNGLSDTGGAVYMGYMSNATIRNCVFRDNNAVTGGAIGGSRYGMILSDCRFENDSSDYGGALFGGTYYDPIRDCRFIGNYASVSGIVAVDSEVGYVQCQFIGNHGPGQVCGYPIDSCLFVDNEGTITRMSYCYSPPAKISNSTFYGNENIFYFGYDGWSQLTNVLIAYNTGYAGSCFNCGGCIYEPHPRLYNCDIFGNDTDYKNTCFGPQETSNNNMSIDPLFCDTSNGDFTLSDDSPCLGAGSDGGNIGLYGRGCSPTDADDEDIVKYIFDLSQNYPNPFNPSTRIDYSIPNRQRVTITIYNLLGQQVITLVDEVKPCGEYSIIWNGCDHQGEPVASGVYFYSLQTDGIAESKKMILLK